VLIWRFWRHLFPQFLIALLLVSYLGLAVYALLPTAPPWLAAQEGHIEGVEKATRQIADRLAPGRYEAGATLAGSNEVAAMPSLHFAVPVLIALVALRTSRWAGRLALAYVAAMAFTLVYLGEHYVVDEIAGLGIAAIAWMITRRLWPEPATHDAEFTAPRVSRLVAAFALVYVAALAARVLWLRTDLGIDETAELGIVLGAGLAAGLPLLKRSSIAKPEAI
jgi:hypothetical protein